MWTHGWRDKIWSQLNDPWDLIVIGGGITGAGILLEAARAGLRVLLVEAKDFASGTSSRSSKLVHGGFRYMKNFQLRLVRESVSERERLVKEGRGLVNSLGFLLVNYAEDVIPDWVFGAGLIFYDLLALKWAHRHYDAYDIRQFYPALAEDGLLGGYRYFDAQTDDARLVLRLMQEAERSGACRRFRIVFGLGHTLSAHLQALTSRNPRVNYVRNIEGVGHMWHYIAEFTSHSLKPSFKVHKPIHVSFN